MRQPIPIAALIQAAVTFAAIGLVALMGVAYLAGDWLTIKLVLVATFGSYAAQLFLVWAEASGNDNEARLLNGVANGVFLVVIILVLVAVGRALIVWG